ncbi:M1 family metallopeptidase [Marinigracilibium pacificum]|uniref:M1 family metallopeptidase n=1 Tax=Marinigracilibium pacificum TaxID=2729599 RepID=A0A848J185_9BACT|nr:M1 family metallopeptidase [Marinigracilibium pacificum]NMM49576.1 M1 family metallopeptidase [Marinigracilibium pacificum]
MNKIFLSLITIFLTTIISDAQILHNDLKTTRADSLRGGLRAERTSYDVKYYHLDIKINPEEKSIAGYNQITFRVVEPTSRIQIDLFDNLKIDSIKLDGELLKYTREFNAVFIDLPSEYTINEVKSLYFYYSGKPTIAKKAPWDGGFVFDKTPSGDHFIAVACQGFGASSWWPNKDHQSDEPDSMLISIAIPEGLKNISNGRFRGVDSLANGYNRWNWFVSNPINNYDVTVNIADYVHFSDTYKDLDLDYWVLPENLEKAKVQFEEVKPMMQCFEEKMGFYPFKEDGYKLVETPYLGMEHQSAVAYGNKYLKGYLGHDLSGSGVGLKWDFIIIHETGHEWYGNSITSSDIADMWIHEGFTQYTEVIYTECRWGYEDAMTYINGLKRNVQNDIPIIGPYGVNKEGSGDMYPKGALFLNTLRHVVNNDDLWWKTFKSYTLDHKKSIVNTVIVQSYFEEKLNMDLEPLFNQYLRTTDIPVLEWKKNGKKYEYRWTRVVDGFNMPVDVIIGNENKRLTPTTTWQKLKLDDNDVNIDVATGQFYIFTKEAAN